MLAAPLVFSDARCELCLTASTAGEARDKIHSSRFCARVFLFFFFPLPRPCSDSQLSQLPHCGFIPMNKGRNRGIYPALHNICNHRLKGIPVDLGKFLGVILFDGAFIIGEFCFHVCPICHGCFDALIEAASVKTDAGIGCCLALRGSLTALRHRSGQGSYTWPPLHALDETEMT